MNLLQGTGGDTVEITKKVTVMLPVSGEGKYKQVKFKAVFDVPVDPDDVIAIKDRLLDGEDSYGDADMVQEFLLRFVDMPLGDGRTLPEDDDELQAKVKEEAVSNRFYLAALATACAEAVFSNEARRKN